MRGKPLLTRPLRTRQAHSRLDDRGHQGGGLLTQRSSPRRARQGRDLAPLSPQALAQTPASLPQPAAVGPRAPRGWRQRMCLGGGAGTRQTGRRNGRGLTGAEGGGQRAVWGRGSKEMKAVRARSGGHKTAAGREAQRGRQSDSRAACRAGTGLAAAARIARRSDHPPHCAPEAPVQ